MAITKMHSFDYTHSFPDMGITAAQGGTSGNTNVTSSNPRTGPGCVQLGSVAYYGPGNISVPVGVNATTAWVQGAFKGNGVNPADTTLVRAREDLNGATHVYLEIDGSTHGLNVRRGWPAGTLLATSVNENLYTTAGIWYFFEFYVYLHDTAGRVVVKWNGATEIDYTGDTNNGGSYINHFYFELPDTGGACWYDDMIVGDGSGTMNTVPPGDARVEYLAPNGVGVKTEFAPSAGSNWSNVDETGTPIDTDYNHSSNVGAMDLFTMADLSGTGVIHAVQPVIRARKDDAGLRSVKPVFYKALGAGDTPRIYAGTAQSVGDSFSYAGQIIETSPDTGVAWGADEIQALQFGYAVAGSAAFGVDAWIREYTP